MLSVIYLLLRNKASINLETFIKSASYECSVDQKSMIHQWMPYFQFSQEFIIRCWL